MDERDKRISLSMKLVDQSTGKDLDPSNAEAQAEVSVTVLRCSRRRILLWPIARLERDSDTRNGGRQVYDVRMERDERLRAAWLLVVLMPHWRCFGANQAPAAWGSMRPGLELVSSARSLERLPCLPRGGNAGTAGENPGHSRQLWSLQA